MNRDIEKRIGRLNCDIVSYWRTLEIESIWLFLAAIGCWSIDSYVYQLAAFSITLLLFMHRVFRRHSNFTPFTKRIAGIENDINSELEGEIRRERLEEILLLKTKISFLPLMKSNYIFSICFIFTFLSFMHAI